MMCNVAGTSARAVSIGMHGTINGTIYTIAVNQDRLSPGTYTYPAPPRSPPPPTLPFVQLVSPTSSAAWTAFQGAGKGTVTIVGGKDTPVSGTIDADLTATSDPPVHAKGSFACAPGQ
jgi:hypothetical protein